MLNVRESPTSRESFDGANSRAQRENKCEVIPSIASNLEMLAKGDPYYRSTCSQGPLTLKPVSPSIER